MMSALFDIDGQSYVHDNHTDRYIPTDHDHYDHPTEDTYDPYDLCLKGLA